MDNIFPLPDHQPTPEPDENQLDEKIHQELVAVLRENELIPEGHILTGWILCYETLDANDDDRTCGHIYGPIQMTAWKALGLIEWVRRFCLSPDSEDDDDA